ncbi:MAG TPA: hypothetical protein VJS39_07380 [Gemmatimonadaceae bacterium]|nr:hypothetical protein [Gemmatimonadaceae bacterium]
MLTRTLWIIFSISSLACSRPNADDRLARYFGLERVPSDTVALSEAILSKLGRGASEHDIAGMLKSNGVGSDSLSSYYPPTDSDTGIVRVEHDPHELEFATTSYGVRLIFDSTRRLSSVRVSRWLTGS